ncbi:MAG: hypothetical protein ACK4UJ_02905 [Leptonema sp. (in: bacteria)]
MFSEEVGNQKLAQQVVSKDTKSKDSNSSFWENFLEIGIINIPKSKEKPPEDLGSVIRSIRIANQFLSNQVTFSLQQTDLVENKPKKLISYSLSPSSKFFVNFTYKFYDNQIEYRRYYDTNENFTLDTYINDYRESKIKFGLGPLNYFKDSIEASFYFFNVSTKGIYQIQNRIIPTEHIGFAGNSTLSYFLYNHLQPSSQPFTYIYGLNKIVTAGFGFLFGSNAKFWKIFSIYQIFDFSLFSVKANLSNLTPSFEFYNTTTKRYEYVPQIINVEKTLDGNMLFQYELGFSITVNKIGFKWGIYWTLPLLLDVDYLKPKGYVIYLSDPIQIQSLEQQVQIFYKGDSSNQTKTFSLGLGGITFGVVSKF